MIKMKKLCVLALLGVTVVCLNSEVGEAKQVVSSYKYDYNTIYKKITSYHSYTYKNVANSAKERSWSCYYISGGWNYSRYLHTKSWY